jgi:hypothetical protein
MTYLFSGVLWEHEESCCTITFNCHLISFLSAPPWQPSWLPPLFSPLWPQDRWMFQVNSRKIFRTVRNDLVPDFGKSMLFAMLLAFFCFTSTYEHPSHHSLPFEELLIVLHIVISIPP